MTRWLWGFTSPFRSVWVVGV